MYKIAKNICCIEKYLSFILYESLSIPVIPVKFLVHQQRRFLIIIFYLYVLNHWDWKFKNHWLYSARFLSQQICKILFLNWVQGIVLEHWGPFVIRLRNNKCDTCHLLLFLSPNSIAKKILVWVSGKKPWTILGVDRILSCHIALRAKALNGHKYLYEKSNFVP